MASSDPIKRKKTEADKEIQQPNEKKLKEIDKKVQSQAQINIPKTQTESSQVIGSHVISKDPNQVLNKQLKLFTNTLKEQLLIHNKLAEEMDLLESKKNDLEQEENDLLENQLLIENELIDLESIFNAEEDLEEKAKISLKISAKQQTIQEIKEAIEKLQDEQSQETTELIANIEERIDELQEKKDAIRDKLENSLKILVKEHIIPSLLNYNIKVELDLNRILDAFFRTEMLDEKEQLIQIDFLKEQLINKISNTTSYLIETAKFLERCKKTLVADFCLGPIDINEVEIMISKVFSDGDRHNRGKQPLEITFFKNKQPISKAVYKPRSGEIDQAIMNLFTKINSLKANEKSMDVDLPVYKIIDLKEGSVHEFIDGVQPIAFSAIEEVDQVISSVEKSIRLSFLHRLESICKAIGLTDLHYENIIFTSNGMIVPIDLEAINPQMETGLWGQNREPPRIELSPTEKGLVQQFIDFRLFAIKRFVPIDTTYFIEFISTPSGHIETARILMKSLMEAGFELKIGQEELQMLLNEDYINGDIPYFTQIGSSLYYGGIEKNHLLAEKKG